MAKETPNQRTAKNVFYLLMQALNCIAALVCFVIAIIVLFHDGGLLWGGIFLGLALFNAAGFKHWQDKIEKL